MEVATLRHGVCVDLFFCRYVEASEGVAEEADKPKLKAVALSCVLNIGACKLKLSDWQGAIESCSEVNVMFSILVKSWPVQTRLQSSCKESSDKLRISK